MPREQERRIAKIESLFRGVNERIAASSRRFGGDDASFVCERDDPQCTDLVKPLVRQAAERLNPRAAGVSSGVIRLTSTR